MQPTLIRQNHSYVARGGCNCRYVARIDRGVVDYTMRVIGVSFTRSETLDEFARWAYEDAELLIQRKSTRSMGTS
ncbi:hypothetical protein FHX06_005650 [Rhizobium sp. BK512]|nr:hypothetical protein [Rhizobium sp. BK512]